MKKILSILGTITLIGTSTTSLVACNTAQEYTKEELKIWKENNKINIANQEIKDNLEPIAPQEKPFDQIDKKYYFVVWRGNENADWKIAKFKNDKDIILDIDIDSHIKLGKTKLFINGYSYGNDLCLQTRSGSAISMTSFQKDNGTYFKSVYRWKFEKNVPNLIVNSKNGEIKIE